MTKPQNTAYKINAGEFYLNCVKTLQTPPSPPEIANAGIEFFIEKDYRSAHTIFDYLCKKNSSNIYYIALNMLSTSYLAYTEKKMSENTFKSALENITTYLILLGQPIEERRIVRDIIKKTLNLTTQN